MTVKPDKHQQEIESFLQEYLASLECERLPIEQLIDGGKLCIRVGDWVSSDFHAIMEVSTEEIVNSNATIMDKLKPISDRLNQCHSDGSIEFRTYYSLLDVYRQKLFYKFLGRKTDFLKALRDKAYAHFINRFDSELITQFCCCFDDSRMFNQKKLIPYRLENYHNCLEIIEQLKDDELTHLLPFVLAFSEDPQALKQRFGKGLWKKLSANTKTRNLSLLNAAEMVAIFKHKRHLIDKENFRANINIHQQKHTVDGFDFFQKEIEVAIRQLYTLKTGLLNNHTFIKKLQFRANFDMFHWANKVAKVTNTSSVEEMFRLFEHTMTYTQVNPNWSLKRMKKEHDDGVQRANATRVKELSKKQDIPLFPHDFTKQLGKVSIKLLNCEYDYALEAMEMNHCLYDVYWNMAQDKCIVSFSLESPTQRTTIAYNVVEPSENNFGKPIEHYGFKNEEVHCADILNCIKSETFLTELKRFTPSQSESISKLPAHLVDMIF